MSENAQTIADLNRQFGTPGRVAFREGPGGFTVAALANPRGGCEVALYGAHVLSYRPVGHTPVLWLGKEAVFKPGLPIRGGIPVCWPWFGPHPDDPARPIHGFARTRTWQVLATEYSGEQTEMRLGLACDEATRALWPHAFELSLRVVLADALRLELTTRNCDTHPFTFTQALHSYFLVRQVMDVTVRGLEQTRYRDCLAPRAGLQLQEGPIVIRSEVDRVYQSTESECVISDPGIGRQIILTKRGSRTTVVWNPWIEKSKRLTDFGDLDYLRMLCVETANADDDDVTLAPGAHHTLALTLRADLKSDAARAP